MILDMEITYIEYFNQVNKVDMGYQIFWIYILGIEQDLYIRNKENENKLSLLSKNKLEKINDMKR